jgi:hypothetical protein
MKNWNAAVVGCVLGFCVTLAGRAGRAHELFCACRDRRNKHAKHQPAPTACKKTSITEQESLNKSHHQRQRITLKPKGLNPVQYRIQAFNSCPVLVIARGRVSAVFPPSEFLLAAGHL